MQDDKNNELKLIGKSIKRLRIKNHWKLETLGVRVGVSASTIYRIECGKSEPKYCTLKYIANAFNIQLSEFFSYVEKQN